MAAWLGITSLFDQKLLCQRHVVPAAMDESLVIATGALGPVPPCRLDIRPLTLLIGRQGTGKSLVAQILYFFRALPFLVDVALAESPGSEPTVEALVRRLLDRLRSPVRAFAGFANPSVALKWTEEPGAQAVGVALNRKNRRARPDKHLKSRIEQLADQPAALPYAVFLPTERILYSMVQTPRAPRLLSLSGTYIDFADWLRRATEVYERWKDGQPDTPQGKWVRRKAADALGGEATRHQRQWKWRYAVGRRGGGTLDIDMASSGQRATWPLILLAEALFTMKRRGQIGDGFTIYVEEPEIHLHPRAEVAVAEILAYMVNQGFRVVVTTHSLTTLYALNNLTQASRLPLHVGGANLPPSKVRLPSDKISAYLFGDGTPRSLVNEKGFIDEGALGSVAEELSAQMNAIAVAVRRTETRERGV